MKFFEELFRRVRIGDKQAAEAIADKAGNAELELDDNKQNIIQFKGQLAELMARTAEVTRKRDAAQAEVDKFVAIAKSAAAAQNADDTKMAIEKRNAAQADLDTYNAEIQRNKKLTDELTAKLGDARKAIASKEGALVRAKAMDKGNELRAKLNQVGTEFSGGSFSATDEYLSKVQQDSDVLDAKEQLDGTSEAAQSASLEEKYSAQSQAVDDEVAQLMAAAAGNQTAAAPAATETTAQ